ncbi:MAG: tRNA (adenosine(37)-N6)-threonylcarbamoyltransferase complex ATPase subunit type 1 TsaE [Xanthomonadales bacterium]|nr:tRNA (adenosine(37)-N6)-threonylcarbamoyltransferase complex ATPase subunit type 1 TsaE [Xanthomonadales bacterium]
MLPTSLPGFRQCSILHDQGLHDQGPHDQGLHEFRRHEACCVSTGQGKTGAWTLSTPDEDKLRELASVFREHLHAPLVVYLRGDLGAGKTTFARALIQSLGYTGRVKSPTYGLLETYSAGGMNILHLDLYRIDHPRDLEQLAIRDLFDEKSLLLVEWPEKGGNFLPPADLELQFGETQGQRCISFCPFSPAGASLSQVVHGAL